MFTFNLQIAFKSPSMKLACHIDLHTFIRLYVGEKVEGKTVKEEKCSSS